MGKQVFKPWRQNQMMLLPPNLEEMIPSEHMVRFINKAIDRLDTHALIDSYRGGGTSAYHPVMLLKVLIYAYASKIYTSRRIAKALREDIHFMWISGMNRPDFRTINNFRSGRLKPFIESIFTSLLELLLEEGFISMKNYFIDGSKWRANANKYSYVWSKNTSRYKTMCQQRIGKLLQEIDDLNEQENRQYGENDLEEKGEGKDINSKEVEEKLQRLKQKIKLEDDGDNEKPSNKKQKKVQTRIKRIEEKELPKLKKYEQQQKHLQGRNSYSKTDHDATFFRMGDGQLIPAYNAMIGSENQFVLNYSVHQQAGDSGLLIPHMRKLKFQLGLMPQNTIGDSAFGSFENYEFIKSYQIGNYLKFNTFHKENTKKHKNNPYLKDNFNYDKSKDEYTCPQGKKLKYTETRDNKSINGYKSEQRVYQCEDCRTCPHASDCKKSDKDRTILVNPKLEEHKQQARENLKSPRGKALRKQRNYDVEAVFGLLKHNGNHRRFILRGLENVNLEFGLLCFAHNIQRWFIKLKAHQNEMANSFSSLIQKSIFIFTKPSLNYIFNVQIL